MALGPDVVVQLLAGATILLLAAWLLLLNARSALHVSFAGFLVVRAGLSTWPLVDRVPGVSDPGESLMPLLQIATLFVIPLMLNSFRRCHCVMHNHSHDKVVLYLNAFFAVCSIVFAGLYLLDSRSYAPIVDRTAILDPSNPVGPLYALTGLDLLSFAWLSLVFSQEYRQATMPLHRSSYLAMSLGFGLLPFYEGLAFIARNILGGTGWAAWNQERGLVGFWLVLAALSVCGMIFELVRHGRTPQPETLKVEVKGAKLHIEVRGYLLLIGSAALCALFLVPAQRIRPDLVNVLDGIFSGFWTLTLPIIVTYAIVRHQLFDVDVRIHKAVKRGTVLATFFAAFFAVSEGAQAYFSSLWGTVFGILSAALLVFVLAPIQQFAEKVADATVPDVKAIEKMSTSERRIFYREQVHIAWGDGVLNRKERALLDHLSKMLGLTPEETGRLEQEALQEVGQAQAPPAAAAPG